MWNEPEVEVIFSVVSEMDRAYSRIVSMLDLLMSQALIPIEASLRNLQQRPGVPFDGSRLDHQDALKQLWRLAYPNRELPSLKSELWKDMGWQGPEPSTDFRYAKDFSLTVYLPPFSHPDVYACSWLFHCCSKGGGFISLENLIFFAKKYPESFNRLLHKQDGNRADWEYPFAVAGINISFVLMQMLDLQAGKPSSMAGIRFLKLLGEDEMAFDDLYCVAFQMMDAPWLVKRASYIEFNDVLKSTRTQLERELSHEDVFSGKDLPAYNLLRR
ncbi:ELMO/CED-12 family protein isoform 3 [Hibiscus syriacus]|uniref:ELMO/CED-12 family protein isoform 3 n=1 Tax=Hibiscus syriacus TaxID=106335 RepID=A0A6A3AT68_HIBSY|nr:ELMO/CED-12 family protein isoform 3 [Hibiscus syriacus]